MGGPPQRGPHVGPQLCQLTRAISFLFLCVLLLLFSPLGCIGSSLKFSGSYPFPWGRERPQNAIIRRQLHLAFLQHTPLLHPSCSSSSSSWREISSSRAPALQAASGSSGEGSKDNTSSSSDNSSSSSDKGQKPSVRVLELTDSARRKLLELREQQGLPPEEDLLLRLAVKSGGCSGLSYSLERIGKTEIREGDYRCRFEPGISVLIDGASFLYVFGTKLDFADQLMNGGFRISNPNASKTCGCGMSFGVPRTFTPSVQIHQKPQKCASTQQQQQQQQQQE